jgi:hypothetical protein
MDKKDDNVCVQGPIRYVRLVNKKNKSVVVLFGEIHDQKSLCNPALCKDKTVLSISEFLRYQNNYNQPVHFFLEIPYGYEGKSRTVGVDDHIFQLQKNFRECFSLLKNPACLVTYPNVVFHFADIRKGIHKGVEACVNNHPKTIHYYQACQLLSLYRLFRYQRSYHDLNNLVDNLLPEVKSTDASPLLIEGNKMSNCLQLLQQIRTAFAENMINMWTATKRVVLQIISIDIEFVFNHNKQSTFKRIQDLGNKQKNPLSSLINICDMISTSPEQVSMLLTLNLQHDSKEVYQPENRYGFGADVVQELGTHVNNMAISWTFAKDLSQVSTLFKWQHGQFIPPWDFVDYFTRTPSSVLQRHIFDILKVTKQLSAINEYKDFKGSVNRLFKTFVGSQLEYWEGDQQNIFLFSKAKDTVDKLLLELRDRIIQLRKLSRNPSTIQNLRSQIHTLAGTLGNKYLLTSFVYINDMYVLARFFRDFRPKDKDLLPFSGIKNAVFYFGDAHIVNYLQFFIQSDYVVTDHIKNENSCLPGVPTRLDFDFNKTNIKQI